MFVFVFIKGGFSLGLDVFVGFFFSFFVGFVLVGNESVFMKISLFGIEGWGR